MIFFPHDTANIDPVIIIGRGTKILQFSQLCQGAGWPYTRTREGSENPVFRGHVKCAQRDRSRQGPFEGIIESR